MLKEVDLLTKNLVDYLTKQLIAFDRKDVIVHFDGSLMSIINIKLLQTHLPSSFTFKPYVVVHNHNKLYLSYLLSLVKQFNIECEVVDITKDLEGHLELDQSALKKRTIDKYLYLAADKRSSLVLSNLCYSHWCLNFPHACYQSLEQVHLLNRFYYSELQQLARHFKLAEQIVDREPSFYLQRNSTDKELLGFTYSDLEDYLRSSTLRPRNHTDSLIRDKLVGDNRQYFLCPLIPRPSKFLA
jgi:NH3-dependent NAD+ synthetase